MSFGKINKNKISPKIECGGGKDKVKNRGNVLIKHYLIKSHVIIKR